MSAHRFLSDERAAEYQRPQEGVLLTQLDVASSVVAVDVPGLVGRVGKGRTYRFRAYLPLTVGATGGVRIELSGTLSVASPGFLIAEVVLRETTNNTTTRVTALDTAVTIAGATAYECIIEGTLQASADGTFTIQFGQSVSNATNSSVLVGAFLSMHEIIYSAATA